MQTIDASDAKTHFSQILNDIEQGKSFIITRHGRKIAIIKPLGEQSESLNRIERAKKAIRKMRRGVTLGADITIRDLIDENKR